MTPEELLFPNLLKVQEIFIKILNSNKAVDVYKTINYYDYAFILLNYFAAVNLAGLLNSNVLKRISWLYLISDLLETLMVTIILKAKQAFSFVTEMVMIMNWAKCYQMPVVFVTGANRGIGLEFARQYLHQGYKVFGTSRAPYSNVKELSEIISKDYHLVLDVSNADSIAKLASNFSKKDIKIDLLINNSGIFLKSDFTTKEKDMAEACMEQFK
ncbi:NAD(P)-binding protein, partial [Rozella allomycis CSF55]